MGSADTLARIWAGSTDVKFSLRLRSLPWKSEPRVRMLPLLNQRRVQLPVVPRTPPPKPTNSGPSNPVWPAWELPQQREWLKSPGLGKKIGQCFNDMLRPMDGARSYPETSVAGPLRKLRPDTTKSVE